MNSLAYLFALLDKWDHTKRNAMIGNLYHEVIRPSFREPQSGNETLRDLMVGPPITYNSFKQKCQELAAEVSEDFLVRSLVLGALGWGVFYGDKTAINEWIERHRGTIAFFEADIKARPEKTELLRPLISNLEEMIAKLPERTETGYQNYCSFCDEVLLPLLSEERKISDAVIEKIRKLSE